MCYICQYRKWNKEGSTFQFPPGEGVGLTTSCSRFPKKFPFFSQKVAQKLLREIRVKSCSKQQKFIFCCYRPLFSLMQKYANCTTKVRFLSISVQFRSIISVARYSPVNLGIFEAQHQTNCNNFFFKAIKVRVAYLAIY